MSVFGKVIQVAGPAVDVEFPEGQIPVIRTAIRITSDGFKVPDPVNIICEVAQHIRLPLQDSSDQLGQVRS